MNGNSCLWLSLFALVILIAAFLTMVCVEIGKMSGGKLKFLEESNKKLSDRLDELFPLREEWVYAGRMTVAVLTMLSMFLFELWWECNKRASCSGPDYVSLWMPLAVILFVYWLMELIGTLLTTAASAKIILMFIPMFRFASLLFFPVVFPLGYLSRKIASNRTKGHEEGTVPTVEDEILSLVEGETAADSASSLADLQDDEKRMILGALELDEINVRRVMTPRVDVTGVEYDENMKLEDFVADAKKAIIESGHSRIPVYNGTIDNVIGIVYSKDLLDTEKITRYESIVHPHPLYIPVSKNIGDLLEEFRQNKIHLAIVVDEYGGTAGIVTFEDVLETLVGDIKDEYDFAEGSLEPKEIKPGVYQCDARMPIAIVNKLLDTELPEDEEFDTIGGYLSFFLGRIPAQGETVHTPIIEAVIKKADGRRAIELVINKKPETEKD